MGLGKKLEFNKFEFIYFDKVLNDHFETILGPRIRMGHQLGWVTHTL